jgi:hypothetical protein
VPNPTFLRPIQAGRAEIRQSEDAAKRDNYLMTPSAVLGPYSAAVNIAEDLGEASPSGLSSYASRIQFNAPAGYGTRILRVYGDFIAFPTQPGVIHSGTSVEIGWGLKTTAPDGSTRVTYPGYPNVSAFDNSFVWVQGSLSALENRARLPYDLDVSVGGKLGVDNIMLSQAFVALNTTGIAIHLEPTFVVVYQFELQSAA